MIGDTGFDSDRYYDPPEELEDDPQVQEVYEMVKAPCCGEYIDKGFISGGKCFHCREATGRVGRIPNPGSPEALAQGCLCPVMDNGHGDEELGRVRGFWYTRGCSVHEEETR